MTHLGWRCGFQRSNDENTAGLAKKNTAGLPDRESRRPSPVPTNRHARTSYKNCGIPVSVPPVYCAQR